MSQTTLGRDMRGIRNPKPNTYVVRVSIHGVQRHVGTFRTHAEALRARNGGIAAPGLSMASKTQAVAAAAVATKKAKSNGVYERFTAEGRVYDVVKYTRGHYAWGGRHKTREAAEQAYRRLVLTQTQHDDTDSEPSLNEPGITVRFKRGRRGSSEPPTPVFVARAFKGGARHLGTFESVEEAREAITLAAAAQPPTVAV